MGRATHQTLGAGPRPLRRPSRRLWDAFRLLGLRTLLCGGRGRGCGGGQGEEWAREGFQLAGGEEPKGRVVRVCGRIRFYFVRIIIMEWMDHFENPFLHKTSHTLFLFSVLILCYSVCAANPFTATPVPSLAYFFLFYPSFLYLIF
jgi:hypothetical protein